MGQPKALRRQPCHRAHLPGALSGTIAQAILGGVVAASLTTLASPALAQVTQQQVRHYEIKAGTLEDALNQLGRQAGILVSFSTSTTAGLRSQGLSGTYTAQQGLSALLAGSGLQASVQGSGSFLIERKAGASTTPTVATLAAVSVTSVREADSALGPVVGYVARRSATATKTDTLLIESPQSVSIVTADEIGDRKAESIDEVLRYTAGVTPNQRPLGSDDSSLMRGFGLETTGIFLDGMRNSGRTFASSIEPYGLERLEVLRGPSSVLYGQVPPGGMVNAVSKRPTAERIREIGVEYGSYDRRTLKADLGGAIDERGEWRYRLTMLGRESGTRLDNDKDNRLYIAPSLTWQPNRDTSLTLMARLQQDNQQYAFPNQVQNPGPLGQVNPRVNLSGYANRFERDNKMIGLDFQHRFNDTWSIRQNLRYNNLKNDRTDLFPAAFVDGRTIRRYLWPVNTQSESLFSDTQLQARFSTGAIAHTVLVGMDYTKISNRDDYKYQVGFVAPLDLYEPVYAPLPLIPSATPRRERYPSRQQGLYVQDQMRWEKVVLTAGLRRDRADQSRATTDLATGVTTDGDAQSPSATTGRLGAVYLFDSGWAPYLSYSTSFAPEVGNSVSGEPLVPSRGKQREAGVRYQPVGQRSLYTASVFDIDRRNVTSAAIANPGRVNQTGSINARGLELEARTELTRQLSVIAQYTYLDTDIERSNNGDQGLPQPGAPKHSTSVWTKYHFQLGDSLQAYSAVGVRYLGRMRSNSDGSHLNLTNPSITLWDAAVGVEHGAWRVSFNINNLFNKQTLFDCGYRPGLCYRSAERTANLSASYRF